METNLSCLHYYLLFLTQNYPHEKVYESALGISGLIVDRFDIIKKILCPPLGKQCNIVGHQDVLLLSSLFELFHVAMGAAIHSQTMPQLSSTEFWLVTFPAISHKAILHITFIQAVYLLISHGPPPNADTRDFAYLLDAWLPLQPSNRPEACVVESKEKMLLPPSEILHHLLLSENPHVLEAAIQAAKPSALCDFVQQFGCPILCVDKVLEFLDDTCKRRAVAKELHQCMRDPTSLARYVDIQTQRGIGNGKGFLSFVRGLANLLPQDIKNDLSARHFKIGVLSSSLQHQTQSVSMKVLPETSSVIKEPKYLFKFSEEELEQQLQNIFIQSGASLSETRKLVSAIECDLRLVLTLWQQSHIVAVSGLADTHLGCLIKALHKLMTRSPIKRMQFLEGMVTKRFSLTLLRLITRSEELGLLGKERGAMFKSILYLISKLLESSNHKFVKLRYYSAFMTVLSDCSRKLKVDSCIEPETDKIAVAVDRVCRDIQASHKPVENEALVVKMSRDTLQGSHLVQFEALVHALSKRSVLLNSESKCIQVLQKIRTAIAGINTVPIAVQCNPELFKAKDGSDSLQMTPDEEMDYEDASTVVTSSTKACPDISGLLVDILELLDPEIINACPEISTRLLFGHSDCLPLSKSPLSSSSSSNMLLSGQGYLLACLVNNSSWSCLLRAVQHVLCKQNIQEWLV